MCREMLEERRGCDPARVPTHLVDKAVGEATLAGILAELKAWRAIPPEAESGPDLVESSKTRRMPLWVRAVSFGQ